MGEPDDLDAPLRGGPRQAPRRRSPLGLAAAFLFLAAISVGAFLLLVDDPLGGEPVATASIERRLGPTSAPAAKAPPPAPAMRDGVPVVDPGDPMPSSGPVIIRVPGADGSAPSGAGAGPGEPIPALLEESEFGRLPRIAPDGTRASDRYARAALAVDGPRVAILLAGLGLDDATTAAAIGYLPAEATLGLAADAPDLAKHLSEARASGRETVLLVPLEGFGTATNPRTLLTGLPPEANLARLRTSMGRAVGYVGLAGVGGAKFAASEAALAPMLVEIGRRGLVFVDAGADPKSLVGRIAADIGLAAASADIVLGPLEDGTAIDAGLADLERLARERGRALLVASPAAVDRIAAWTAGLSARGVTLVPVSALTLPHGAALAGAR